MFNLFIKYFIITLLMALTLASLFIKDLMIIWLIMEISNFLFISYVSFNSKNKKMIFFYYFIQVIPSLTLIISITMNFMSIFNHTVLTILMLLSLMIKLGVPPLHLWMLLFTPYLNWIQLFFILTIQKIIPLYILSSTPMPSYFITLSLLACALIPPIMMTNLTNLKKLLTYSSINQLGWLILMIYLNSTLWISYFTMYALISFLIFYTFSYKKIHHNFLENKKSNNILILMMMLNMASIPPFSFFIFKWFGIMFVIMNSNMFFLPTIMTLSSFLMFFMYMNMVYLCMFSNLPNSKMINLLNTKNTYLNILFILIIMILSIYMTMI